MKNNRVLITVSTFLVMLIYIASVCAEDSILKFVPEDTTGFIYMGNPMRLSQKVDKLASDMTNSQQDNLLAKKLADTFGADFKSLDELQQNGFDLKKELCIFFRQNSEKNAVIVHASSADKIESLLREKVGSMKDMEYEGIKYYLSNDGIFTVFDGLFVMTSLEDTFKKIVDTYQDKNNSILQSSDYRSLELDISPNDEIVIFLDVNEIVRIHSSKIQKLKQEAKSSLEDYPQDELRRTPEDMSETMINYGIWMAEQLELYTLKANLEGSIGKLTSLVKFKEESEIQEFVSTKPTELNFLNLLPHGSFLAGSAVFKKENWIDIFNTVSKVSQENIDTDSQKYKKFIDRMEEFHAHFGREFAFAVDISYSMIPDFLYIYETEDDEAAAEYMKKDYIEYLKAVSSLSERTLGLSSANANKRLEIMSDATLGDTEIYADVEIQQIKFPKFDKAFTDMPKEIKPLTPKNWSIWYAIKDGKLILAMSSSPDTIKQVIDVMNGFSENIKSDKNYKILTPSDENKNNFLVYFSPVMTVKKVSRLVSQTNPDIGNMFTMMFNELPESYNISISGVNRDKGIQFDSTILLDELKQLVQILLAVSQQTKNNR